MSPNLFYEGRPQNGIYVVRSLGIDPANGQEIFLDKDGNRDGYLEGFR